MKSATLREVASAAGIHLATASAVLNGSRGSTRVSAATRAAVLAAAQALGYVRNESASHLRTGLSAAVGFIGGDLRNPFFAELSAEIEKELGLRQHQLVISHVASDDHASFQNALRVMRGQALHSIIYWDELGDAATPPVSSRTKMLPIGFTSRPRSGVWLDLEHAIRQSVDYLVSAGYRRLGFFAPALRGESPSVQARWDIFHRECGSHGLPEPIRASYAGESWDVEAAIAGARETFRTPARADAYLSFNDTAALGLLLARIPRLKPAVVCFDGTGLVRRWPGHPPYLDLKLRDLARLCVAVQMGERSARSLGLRAHWLRPAIIS